jgi:hypothetical protein
MRGSARGKYLNCCSVRAPWLSKVPHTPVEGMSRVLLKLAKRSLPSMILRDFEL